LEAVKHEIGHILHNVQCAYVNGMALRNLYTEKERHFLFNLSQHPAAEVLRIPNCLSHMNSLAASSLGSDFGTLKILLDLSEQSAEFQEAHGILQPLVDRVAELEAEIMEENAVAGRAANALAEAIEAARQAAEDKLAKDPAVIAARKALDAAQPALVPQPALDTSPPFRGKVKIEEPALA
jgi:aminopeptidase N